MKRIILLIWGFVKKPFRFIWRQIRRHFWLMFIGFFVLLTLAALWYRKIKIISGLKSFFKSIVVNWKLDLAAILFLAVFIVLIFLFKKTSRKKLWSVLAFIVILVILSFLIVFPPKNLRNFLDSRGIKVRQGLDLQGGTELTYEIDTSKVGASNIGKAMTSLREVIDRRVNAFGVSEPVIQTSINEKGDYRLIVDLPGIKDVNQALDLIGKTAQLDFKEQAPEEPGKKDKELQTSLYGNWKSTGLTGEHLKSADVTTNYQSGKIEVALEFNEQGKKLFSEITKRNIGKIVAIFLDEMPISTPTVQSEITEGKAVITGDFDIQSARKLAIQLNAGALPVSLKLASQTNIGATLGRESVKKSLIAGIIGLSVVVLFMILNYGIPGFLADVALLIYTLILFAIFKISGLTPWPVVLTLGGIAGFILSIGMAVDANILIFERTKEELREGKTLRTSIEEGFKRAWSSIRDSNASSLITCVILYWMGTGMIRGFALILALGIFVGLFTAITVSRTFLRILITIPFVTRRFKLFGVKVHEET